MDFRLARIASVSRTSIVPAWARYKRYMTAFERNGAMARKDMQVLRIVHGNHDTYQVFAIFFGHAEVNTRTRSVYVRRNLPHQSGGGQQMFRRYDIA